MVGKGSLEIYVTKLFDRWAKGEAISDTSLCQAVSEIEDGLVEANLGGGLYKKRIGGRGKGKRGSYRTLLAFKSENRAVFVFGFAKKEKSNIDDKEKKVLKRLAKEFLEHSSKKIKQQITAKTLRKLECQNE